MSQSNGDDIIKIGRRGMKKFQLGDGDPVVELDVTAVHNEWIAIDREFRDADRKIPKEHAKEHEDSAVRFARDHLQNQSVNVAEALGFIARLLEEVAKLEDFFTPHLPEKQDSPDSSTRIVFSQ